MENTNNKIKAAVVAAGIVAGIIKLAMGPPGVNHLLSNTLWLIGMIATLTILRDGRVLQVKPYNILLYLSVPVIIVAMMFKIMHWPGANVMLILSWGGASLVYLLWYISKTEKVLLDMMKMLFFCTMLLANLMQILQWQEGKTLMYFSDAAYIAMCCCYIFDKLKSHPQPDNA
ncbi:MAG: hypothetical protein JST90_10410 [Bacteroidetes bacterium]|nr:hypothetical protein [Bacteroidota bacterium]